MTDNTATQHIVGSQVTLEQLQELATDLQKPETQELITQEIRRLLEEDDGGLKDLVTRATQQLKEIRETMQAFTVSPTK